MAVIKKYGFFLWLFFPVFFGCIRDVTLEESEKTREIVLNGILDAGKDTISVYLSHTRTIVTTTTFEAIKNADIRLFEGGKEVGRFDWSDSSAYILPFSVTPGQTYKVEAKADGKTIWAETTVPNSIDATIGKAIPGNYLDPFQISLNSSGDKDNYYWISATGNEGPSANPVINIACFLYSSFEYADDFNQRISQNEIFFFEYDYYLRFTNKEISDNVARIVFSPQCIRYPKKVFLLSADYHLDRYMKSSLLLQDMDLYAEDSPIIYSPFPMYSNINGGTGIFGSFNSVSKVFTKTTNP